MLRRASPSGCSIPTIQAGSADCASRATPATAGPLPATATATWGWSPTGRSESPSPAKQRQPKTVRSAPRTGTCTVRSAYTSSRRPKPLSSRASTSHTGKPVPWTGRRDTSAGCPISYRPTGACSRIGITRIIRPTPSTQRATRRAHKPCSRPSSRSNERGSTMTKSPLLALAAPISRKTSYSWRKERRSNITRKGDHPTAAPLQEFGIREQLDERQPGDEAADVRPDRHAAALRTGDDAHGAEQQLQQEPVAEDHVRGQGDRRKEKAQRDERMHAHARVQHDVRPHHAADRPRRTDHRHSGAGIDDHLGRRGRYAGQQVEHHKSGVPHRVLDVVPEHPQEPHVADQVQPTTVHEHRGDDRPPVRVGGEDAA